MAIENTENKDIFWFWEIKESLKELMESITTWITTFLRWKKEWTGEKKDENKDEVENQDKWTDEKEKNWDRKAEKNNNKKENTKKEEKKLKEELRHKERQSKWKFTISEWIFANEANAQFKKNWAKTDKKIILNWPLFAPWWMPVWWFIENWIVKKNFTTKINEKDPWNFSYNNWIFWYWTDWQMHMFSYKDIDNQEWNKIKLKNGEEITFTWAFQNWPMLVQNWIIQTTSNKKSVNRTCIWFLPSWEIRAVQAKWVTLAELANYCKEEWLKNVMYLDWSNWIAWMKNWNTWDKRWEFAAWATWLQLW